ncbi:general transcription factor IIF subunit 1 [Vanessa tameamea]|uniref:Transcription initiation factor IIF subunit alpha n=1 Tax=Vanessa tameamea TaxID=334116 RepID=A0A8B8HHL8_VANTA|nr:general transcription factor IIF subunit 1 [Vanessa tameamea]
MTTPSSSQAGSVQEFKIRVPKNVKKKYHVMRFNATLNVDFAKWTNVKMERENNIKEFKGIEEDMPKFGAGSEYGRDMREEARRKKFGIISRKYKPEDQPWILKVGGKTGKKFKGIREGGVSENAAYYVFTHADDGAIDAYPLQEWYNFQPIQRYKALSAEEAEQEFGRRNKVINYFSLMFRKRMRGDDAPDDGDDPDDKKTKGGKAKKDLKISEMDEWIDSDDESSDSEAGEKDKDKEDSDSGAKKKKNKKGAVNKKKKKVNDEAFEESDDGDEEGREKDYISDSSDSESDHETKANKELKGVAEEDALRKLLTSDEDSEEEQEQKQESEQEDEPTKEGEERASKLTKKKKKPDEAKKDSSSEFSSDSDTDPESSSKKPKKTKNGTVDGKNASGAGGAGGAGGAAASGAAAAVAAANAAANQPAAKRTKLDPSYTECGVTEEAVRRYLARKPMTTTELLTKFKSKRTGVSSERLVETMTQILKRINPVKQNINGKMYLSIKQT